MRRTSVDFGIPLLTNIQLVNCFADAINEYKKGDLMGLDSKSLFEHYEKESPEDFWTAAEEYH